MWQQLQSCLAVTKVRLQGVEKADGGQAKILLAAEYKDN